MKPGVVSPRQLVAQSLDAGESNSPVADGQDLGSTSFFGQLSGAISMASTPQSEPEERPRLREGDEGKKGSAADQSTETLLQLGFPASCVALQTQPIPDTQLAFTPPNPSGSMGSPSLPEGTQLSQGTPPSAPEQCPQEKAADPLGANCLLSPALRFLLPGQATASAQISVPNGPQKAPEITQTPLREGIKTLGMDPKMHMSSPQEPAGTFSALEQRTMVKSSSTELQFAGCGEDPNNPEPRRALVARSNSPRISVAGSGPADTSFSVAPHQGQQVDRTVVSGGVVEIQLTPLRLVQSIVTEVAALRQMNGSSISVVLRPDSGTEVKLRMHYKDGRIEAAASCERGDFGALSAHWADLRRTLEAQGVSMGELQRGASDTNCRQDFNQAPHQDRPDHTERDVRQSALADSASRKPAISPRRSVVGSKHLLESWA